MYPEMNQTMAMQWHHGRARTAIAPGDLFDHRIVGADGNNARSVDPVEQRLIKPVQTGRGGEHRLVHRRAIAQDQVGIAGINAQEIALFRFGTLAFKRTHQGIIPDRCQRPDAGRAQIDQHPAALDAGLGQLLDPQRQRGGGCCRVRHGEMGVHAEAVVEYLFGHPIAIGVKTGAVVAQSIPLG